MKHTKHLLALIAVAALAVSAWAQSADDDYQKIHTPLTDKNAKLDAAAFPQLSKAVIDFLVAYPGDKRAPGIVSDTLNYGGRLQAANKTPALAQSWYLHVQGVILDKQIDSGVSPEAKDALTALMAAMAEGEMKATPTPDNLNAWRGKLDKLLAAPTGTPFVLDREKSFYNIIAKIPNYQKLVTDQLTQLSQHKDKNISGWAKQEMKYIEMKKTPLTLSVTTLDGKKFDTAALKNSPMLYLYFWSISDKKADADMKNLVAKYNATKRAQLEFLAVCCDPEEKRDEVNAFIKKNQIKLPVYFDGKGKKGDLCEKFGVSRTPIGFLFDGKGNLLSAGFNYAEIGKSSSGKNK